jgi:hypothetical protein
LLFYGWRFRGKNFQLRASHKGKWCQPPHFKNSFARCTSTPPAGAAIAQKGQWVQRAIFDSPSQPVEFKADHNFKRPMARLLPCN